MTESPCRRAGWGHPTSAGIFSFVSGPLLLLTNHILIKDYLGRLWGHGRNHGDTALKTHGLCGPVVTHKYSQTMTGECPMSRGDGCRLGEDPGEAGRE